MCELLFIEFRTGEGADETKFLTTDVKLDTILSILYLLSDAFRGSIWLM